LLFFREEAPSSPAYKSGDEYRVYVSMRIAVNHRPAVQNRLTDKELVITRTEVGR